MTQVVFSQRALVEASMRLAPTTAERHGSYALHKVVPGSNAQPKAGALVESNPRVYAREGEERGCDPCPPAPTRCLCPVGGGGHIGNEHYSDCPLSPEYATNFESRTCRCCSHSSGTPMLTSRLEAKGWNGSVCPVCMWAEPQCIARQIPGSRRAA